jgi:pimeloyl-ACP methyl ester carboxylesterase
MNAHEKLRNVLMALVFWFGLSAVCVGMMMALPILVVLASGVNLVMFFSSSLSCACFPTDAQIQKLEEHLLMMHVQAPLEHIWSELHLQVNNSIIKCSAHCLSIRNTSQESAPTILLLHGTGASATSFAKCFDRLSQNFHVLALDLPGFGRSQTEFDFSDAGRRHLQNMETDLWLEFIEAFLDARSLDTVILLGHSYGGFISVKFAARRPQRVSRLFLVNSAGIFPTLGKLGCYWAIAFKFSLPQLFRVLVPPVGAWIYLSTAWGLGHDEESRYWFGVTQHPRGWGDRCIANDIYLSRVGMSAFWKRPAISDLLGLSCPIITIYGEEDTIMPIHQGRLLEDLFGIPCLCVPGTGHSPFHGTDALVLVDFICEKKDFSLRRRKIILPAIRWDLYISTFSTSSTENVIDSLYANLRPDPH